MIRSRKDLEDRVLEYSPELRSKIENGDSRAKYELEKIADRHFETYKPYLDKVPGKVSKGLGYLGDVVFWGSAIAAAVNPLLAPYMLTGLLLKKIYLATQIPGVVRDAKYAATKKEVRGTALLDLAAKVASYAPGLTAVNAGVGKLAERKMIRKTAYDIKEALGEEKESWHKRYAQDLKGKYADVKDRAANIIGPRRGPALAAA